LFRGEFPDLAAVRRGVCGAQALTQLGASRLTAQAAVVGLRLAAICFAAAASRRSLAAATSLERTAVKSSGFTQYSSSSSSAVMAP
jgi:hypothetical protein